MKTQSPNLAVLAGVTVAFYGAAQLGLRMAAPFGGAAPIWPPTGVALAALLLLGYRAWPGVLCGALLASLTKSSLAGVELGPALVVALGSGLGHSAEALAGAWLVRRYANGAAAFEQPQTVFRFVLLAAVLSTTFCPTLSLLIACASGARHWSAFANTWSAWWLARLVSNLVLAPLLLTWLRRPWPAFNLRRFAELLLVLMLLAALWDVCETWTTASARVMPLDFLVIPLLVWASFRFGPHGTALAVALLGGHVIFGAWRGEGPFAGAHPAASLLLLQSFLSVLSIMSFVLAADAAQRRRAEAGLRESEQRYRDLFESNPQPMWVYDCETLRFLEVNAAAIRHYGYNRQEFASLRITDLRPPDDVPALLAALADARLGRPVPNHWRHRKKDGTVFDVEVTRRNLVFAQRPAAMVLVTDVTARNQMERQTAAFSYLGRRLSAAGTPREAAQIIAETADSLFGWDACLMDLCPSGCGKVQTIYCVDTIDGRRTEVPLPSTDAGVLTAQVLAHGAQLILREDPVAFAEDLRRFGDTSRPSASIMYVPVHKDAQVIGVFSIQSYSRNAYSPENLRTLQSLADHCGGALERIRAEQEIVRLNIELERRVRERTAQLEAINKELEAFSYSVSHDLRAPLRTIRGFSEVLLERYSPQLDSRGQDFLRRACESSQHMDRLIESLLTLSRVGRGELQRRWINLSLLARTIATELHKTDPGRAVDFSIQPDLQAYGDERLIHIALDNLLRNAWKFTRRQPTPRIEVGALDQAGEHGFFVRDNGAGFDMTYGDKLFGVFQRLHTASEFPGTGVGLATVQRIINRHGGRAWATGTVNQGATFFFTLPYEHLPPSPGR